MREGPTFPAFLHMYLPLLLLLCLALITFCLLPLPVSHGDAIYGCSRIRAPPFPWEANLRLVSCCCLYNTILPPGWLVGGALIGFDKATDVTGSMTLKALTYCSFSCVYMFAIIVCIIVCMYNIFRGGQVWSCTFATTHTRTHTLTASKAAKDS